MLPVVHVVAHNVGLVPTVTDSVATMGQLPVTSTAEVSRQQSEPAQSELAPHLI